jgi:Ca2+/H+ antiporter
MVKSSEILYVCIYIVVRQQKELTFVNSSLISSVLIENNLQLT